MLELEMKQQIREEGFLTQFTPTEFIVFMAIQSFTDIKGSAFPSQETIAKVSGVSLSSVKRATSSLEEKGIIERSRKTIKSPTIYTVNNIQKEGQDQEQSNTRKYNTAQDWLEAFKQQYKIKYGVAYLGNDRSDLGLIKAKLIDQFTDEQLDAILEITFRDYQIRWSNQNYPRPVIGGVCSFIGRKALEVWEQEQNKKKKVEQAGQEDLDKYFDNQDF